MTVTSYPNDGTPLSEAMLTNILYALGRDGVLSTPDASFDLNRLVVTAGSGMQVLVASGRALVGGQLVTNDASAPLVIANADGTNPRIDLVVARNTLTTDTPELAVKTGTPSANPEIGKPTPTVTASVRELALAEVYVGAGVSSISAGNLTDRRAWVRATNHVPTVVQRTITTDDYQDTQTSFTLITHMTAAIVSDGGDIRADFSESFTFAGSTNFEVAVRIDGGSWVTRAHLNGVAGSGPGFVSFRHTFTGVSAGRHTVEVGFKTSSSVQVTLYGDRRLEVMLA